ncbi:hypothetical protein CJ673_09150 [Aliarcobacter cryaerophilus]|jgi:hypothetical protein|uniref:Uncharacterized protein n=2 Tax=Aliarcobacter cryaerophilus TaxID=28198 RepID=A0A2S9T4S5_9BACT|nr:hypothetical protein [Aliarcobacter cryaerophilus]PRM93826.1 hypothetical protein CJ673_09150 [Aliarcobacter cryaerophilus]
MEELLKKINGNLIEIKSKLDKDTFNISGGSNNIGQQNNNNYYMAQSILTNHFLKKYFIFRNRKSVNEKSNKEYNLTMAKLFRYIFYFLGFLFFTAACFSFFSDFNNFIGLDRKAESVLSLLTSSFMIFLFTFFHHLVDKAFTNDKDIIELNLEPYDKGRFYFKIDLIFIISLFLVSYFM